MKRFLLHILPVAGLVAQAYHLDIMVPDRADTDLIGPVKRVDSMYASTYPLNTPRTCANTIGPETNE